MPVEACPECASERFTHTDGGLLRCLDCGFQRPEPGRPCPNCGHSNDEGAAVCARCGGSLDVVERVLRRQVARGTPQWLQEARERAPGIKELEEASSQQRLNKLIEADRERIEALRAEQEQQAAHERRTLSATILFTALALLIIVIATLAITLRG